MPDGSNSSILEQVEKKFTPEDLLYFLHLQMALPSDENIEPQLLEKFPGLSNDPAMLETCKESVRRTRQVESILFLDVLREIMEDRAYFAQQYFENSKFLQSCAFMQERRASMPVLDPFCPEGTFLDADQSLSDELKSALYRRSSIEERLDRIFGSPLSKAVQDVKTYVREDRIFWRMARAFHMNSCEKEEGDAKKDKDTFSGEMKREQNRIAVTKAREEILPIFRVAIAEEDLAMEDEGVLSASPAKVRDHIFPFYESFLPDIQFSKEHKALLFFRLWEDTMIPLWGKALEGKDFSLRSDEIVLEEMKEELKYCALMIRTKRNREKRIEKKRQHESYKNAPVGKRERMEALTIFARGSFLSILLSNEAERKYFMERFKVQDFFQNGECLLAPNDLKL